MSKPNDLTHLSGGISFIHDKIYDPTPKSIATLASFWLHHFFLCDLLLVILVLLLGLGGGLGDPVQIPLAGLGDASAALLLVLLEDANLLEGLHDLAVDRARGVDVLGGARAAVDGGAVHLAEAADADRLAEVDVAGDGGGADVEPVNVLGGELLGDTSLDGVDPTWRGIELAGES